MVATGVRPSEAAHEPRSRPLITLDFDGVICSPPFGLNLGITADFLDPLAPAPTASVPPRAFGELADYVRFNFRRPMHDAAESLRALAKLREIVVLTGRRTSPHDWLARHDLDQYIEEIIVNDTDLKSPHFKLQMVEALRPSEHVDDDGRTAQLLAQANTVGTHVFLCDWPRNRAPGYAPGVTRTSGLSGVVEALH